MKIKILMIGLCILTMLSRAISQQVEIRVMDEQSNPVAGATIVVSFDTLIGGDRFYEPEQLTDENGLAFFRGRGPGGITFWAKKVGHYSYGYLPAERDRFAREAMPETIKRELILKNILNPRPLYVRTIPVSPAKPFRIPAEKTWLGFDFEHGDWVAPHGEGKVADILFRYEREFHGIFIPRFTNTTEERRRENIRGRYERQGKEFTEEKFREEAGKWTGVLEIAFPNEEAGILRVVDDYKVHSVLRMPHQAPENGYQLSYRYETETHAPPHTATTSVFSFAPGWNSTRMVKSSPPTTLKYTGISSLARLAT